MNESPTPIAYAAPGLIRRPPMDWSATTRQAVFSLGVGSVAFAIAIWLSADGRSDSSPLPAGFGAFLTTIALPWPGRVGRRREDR